MELIESKSERTDLNVDEDAMRYESIANIQYKLTLALLPGNTYQGHVEVIFEYKGENNIFIDYAGKYIKYIIVNGVKADAHKIFHNQRIFPENLVQGTNSVKVYFVNQYSQSGLGIHHFKDPEDNEEYTYTQFESFFAHDCFPCFDQPDLKAKMEFTSVAPSKWQIISNEREYESIQLPNPKLLEKCPEDFKEFNTSDYTMKAFPFTDKISSYLYAIVAGPLCFYEDTTSGFPPMRIFMRKTLKTFVEGFKDEFFYAIKAGIRYYEDYFGVKFPWHKYDQIYCPEYKFGAMENVGAVTFNESRYIFKSAPTIYERTRFVVVILHELAHMWFGDLITMKWWNNLWLNESFATFMSIMALKYADLKKYEYVDPWTHFILYKKVSFNDDQMPSTHPILNNARTTEEAENSFDGITYGKGASCLKQLCYFIGEDTFIEGVKSYFKKYAWKNTTFDDFIGEMKIAFAKKGGDLAKWSEQWLKTSGMNILKPIYKIKDGKISSFEISQNMTPYGINIYREHLLDIALFDKNMKLTVIPRIKIEAKYITEVKEVIGKEEPFAVFVNVNDWSFAKIEIDEASIKNMNSNICKIDHELTRSQIYRSYYDMAKDGKIKPTGYLNAVINNLGTEKSIEILQQQMMFTEGILSLFLSPAKKAAIKEALMKMAEEILKSSDSIDVKSTILAYTHRFMNKKEDYDIVIRWMKEGINGKAHITIPIKSKYQLLIAVFGSSFYTKEEKESLYAMCTSGDKSDDAERLRFACNAADPNPETKKAIWNWYITKEKKESDETLIASMNAFHQPGQDLDIYDEKFYDDISGVFDNTVKRRFAEAFFTALCPLDKKPEHQAKLLKLLNACTEGQDTRKKLYSQALENMKVIAKIYEN